SDLFINSCTFQHFILWTIFPNWWLQTSFSFSTKLVRNLIKEGIAILNRSFHYSSPPFSRFLNQSLNLSLFGTGKSRTSVHSFSIPTPFVILSPFEIGFVRVGASFEPI